MDRSKFASELVRYINNFFASSDCGLSWQNIWEEAGINLVTTNPVYNGFEWFQSNNGDWKSVNVNLNNYSNKDGIIIKFRNVNQYENNLFLDNIGISADVSLSSVDFDNNLIDVYPNQLRNILMLIMMEKKRFIIF